MKLCRFLSEIRRRLLLENGLLQARGAAACAAKRHPAARGMAAALDTKYSCLPPCGEHRDLNDKKNHLIETFDFYK